MTRAGRRRSLTTVLVVVAIVAAGLAVAVVATVLVLRGSDRARASGRCREVVYRFEAQRLRTDRVAAVLHAHGLVPDAEWRVRLRLGQRRVLDESLVTDAHARVVVRRELGVGPGRVDLTARFGPVDRPTCDSRVVLG